MNVTLNWLKNYIDFELSPSELADRLTMLGIEVESVKQLGAEFGRRGRGQCWLHHAASKMPTNLYCVR